jgi:hypothetical protein
MEEITSSVDKYVARAHRYRRELRRVD